MSKFIKAIVSVAVIAAYLLLLRYVAPGREPFFLLGTAVTGIVAWQNGSVAGLGTMLLLIPATHWIYGQLESAALHATIMVSPAHLVLQGFAAVALGHLRNNKDALGKSEAELQNSNARLMVALSEVREPGGIYNLCSGCKSIQDKDGHWQQIDVYLKEQTKMEFSHRICPQCAERIYTNGNDSKSG